MSTDLTLRRDSSGPTGIVSTLLRPSGVVLCRTLSHAYQQDDGSWLPKVPPGRYLCVFGQHQLTHGPIQTFEITGVPGHSGILFHPGNSNGDSEGCELPGQAFAILGSESWMVRSEAAWLDLLSSQGTESFWLTVEGPDAAAA